MKRPRKKPEPEPEPEPKHGTTSESMVAWRCKCGASWGNHKLRGKSDGELTIERDSAFLQHLREMEKGGWL